MIFRILDNVRTKPEPVRRQLAVLSVCVIMFVIILIWVVTLPERLSGVVAETKESVSPMSVIVEQSKDFYVGISNDVLDIKDALNDNYALPAATILSEGGDEDVMDLAPDLLGDVIFDDVSTVISTASTTP